MISRSVSWSWPQSSRTGIVAISSPARCPAPSAGGGRRRGEDGSARRRRRWRCQPGALPGACVPRGAVFGQQPQVGKQLNVLGCAVAGPAPSRCTRPGECGHRRLGHDEGLQCVADVLLDAGLQPRSSLVRATAGRRCSYPAGGPVPLCRSSSLRRSLLAMNSWRPAGPELAEMQGTGVPR